MRSPPVLVVDDDPDFLDLARSILEQASPPFDVHIVTTGEQALSFLEQRHPFIDAPSPRFVVLDMRLPDMTAVDVLRKGHEWLEGIPILVVTQALWQSDAGAAREAGASAVREKPGKLAALRALLLDFGANRLDCDASRSR
jgi:chemotaxis family two-component system response regulator Rcp1